MKTLKSIVTLMPIISIFLVIVGYFSVNYSVYVEYYEYIKNVSFTLMFDTMLIFIAFYWKLCYATRIASVAIFIFSAINLLDEYLCLGDLYYYAPFKVGVFIIILIYSFITIIKKKWLN